MFEKAFLLSQLPIGGKAKVLYINTEAGMKRRLLDLGLTQGTVVEAVQKSPAGDPVAYLIRGAVIALRTEDAAAVLLART